MGNLILPNDTRRLLTPTPGVTAPAIQIGVGRHGDKVMVAFGPQGQQIPIFLEAAAWRQIAAVGNAVADAIEAEAKQAEAIDHPELEIVETGAAGIESTG